MMKYLGLASKDKKEIFRYLEKNYGISQNTNFHLSNKKFP